jgi:hypothetical protein
MKRCDCQGERIAGLCIHDWERRAHGEGALLRRSISLQERAERDRDEARSAAKEILLDSVSWDEPSYQRLCEGVWKAFPWLKTNGI